MKHSRQNTPHFVTGDTVQVGNVLSVGHGTSHWRNVKVTEVGERVFYGHTGSTTRVKYHDGTSDVIYAGQRREFLTDDSPLGVTHSWMTVPK